MQLSTPKNNSMIQFWHQFQHQQKSNIAEILVWQILAAGYGNTISAKSQYLHIIPKQYHAATTPVQYFSTQLCTLPDTGIRYTSNNNSYTFPKLYHARNTGWLNI